MNFAKFIQGIIAGALFLGILSAICAVYISFTSDTTDSLGMETKDWWWILMLYAGFFGLIVGAILGGIISALNLSLITAGLCGFLITAIPAILLRLPSAAKEIDENISRFGICFIIIATLTGIFVSYIQTAFSNSE